jgi:hypothetical protein
MSSIATKDGTELNYTYADDLAALVEKRDLKRDSRGHSTGGGEVARYIGRLGTTPSQRPG